MRPSPHGAEGLRFFREKIEPVLVAECYRCHSARAEKVKGGLRLDSRAGMLRGETPAPRSSRERSARACSSRPSGTRTAWRCRPRSRSSPDAIDRRLRDVGGSGRARSRGREASAAAAATWTRRAGTGPSSRCGRPRRRRSADAAWVQNADRRLRPGEAGRAGLAARAAGRPGRMDPPRHVRPDRPAADARGGRGVRGTTRRPTPTSGWSTGCWPARATASGWAQHWLDVVRFAETEGYEYDRHVPDAWRFRDYVIDCAEPRQAVRPLPDRADRRRRDRPGRPRVPDRVDLPPARPGAAERRQPRDRPEPQRGPDRADRHPRHGVPRADGRLRPLPRPQARADLAEGLLPAPGLPRGDRGARHRRSPPRRNAASWEAKTKRAQGARSTRLKKRRQAGDRRRRRRGWTTEIEALEDQLPPPLADDPEHPERLRPSAPRSTSCRRGVWENKGEPVGPRPPSILVADDQPELPADVPDPRTHLARWLASPDHPLTRPGHRQPALAAPFRRRAGRRRSNDFGTEGRPAQPPRAARLAGGDAGRGRLAAQADPPADRPEQHLPAVEPVARRSRGRGASDPENRLLWQFPGRRLTAEEIRDAMLAVSGRLNPKAGGPSVMVPVDPELVAAPVQARAVAGRPRRRPSTTAVRST